MALRKTSPRHEDPQPYILRKEYKKAVELYRLRLQGSAGDVKILLRMADCLVLDNQIPAAVEQYKKVAEMYAEQGFLVKAIGVNKKIVKLDPSQAEVHDRLSKLYEARGLLAPRTSPTAAPRAGGFQFDMEEASDEGLELELGPLPGARAPAGGLLEEDSSVELDASDLSELLESAELAADFGAGDLEGLAAGGLTAAEGAPEIASDELVPDGTQAGLAEEPAALELEEPVRPGRAGAAPEEISVDDLSAAFDGLGEQLEEAPAEPPGAVEGYEFQKTPLFSDLTAAELVEVVKEMSHETYPKDAVIVREGEPGDCLFVIVNGSVRVITEAQGKELLLAELGEGEFFGEGSLITGKPRTATIIANEESELLGLTRHALELITSQHPRVQDVMLQFYKRRAENTVKTILGARK